MGSYISHVYHIIFSTKHRARVITADNEKRLYTYLWNTLKNKKCHVYRIGGVEDHIHIVTHIHQSLAVADVMKDLKSGSSKFIKENALFPGFEAWQIGYGSFTCRNSDLKVLIRYVKNQKEHHAKSSFVKELKSLLKEHNVEYDEKFLV